MLSNEIQCMLSGGIQCIHSDTVINVQIKIAGWVKTVEGRFGLLVGKSHQMFLYSA
jgi:hypothetical protein